jgi:transposase
MACASVVSPIEIFAADEVGRRRHWSDADKVRIVEESLRGHRQGSATARRYGISRSLLTTWRREYRAGAVDGHGTGGGFVPLVVEDVTPTRREVPVVPAAMETIDITLTNGRRMTIPVSLAPVHLAALLAVLDPR